MKKRVMAAILGCSLATVIGMTANAEGLKFGLHGTATLATESAGAED